MSTNEPDDGGGWSPPSWFSALSTFGQRIEQYRDERQISTVRAVTLAMLSFVLPGLVTTFIIKPTLWTVSLFGMAADAYANAAAAAEGVLATNLEPVADAILGTVTGVTAPIEEVLLSTGLAGPIVGAIIGSMLATVVALVVFVLLRIIIDVIPGGGGILP